MLNITPKFHTTVMFVIIYILKIIHTETVGVFMIYLHNLMFLTPVSQYLLLSNEKLSKDFMGLFYISIRIYLNKRCIFLKVHYQAHFHELVLICY
jgi:hypothetical protein